MILRMGDDGEEEDVIDQSNENGHCHHELMVQIKIKLSK